MEPCRKRRKDQVDTVSSAYTPRPVARVGAMFRSVILIGQCRNYGRGNRSCRIRPIRFAWNNVV